MCEDLAPLIVVQHAGDGTEFDGREGEQQRLGTVLHQDPDHVAALDALLDEHVGVAVHPLIRLPIADRGTVEPDERPVRLASRQVLEDTADGFARVRLAGEAECAASQARNLRRHAWQLQRQLHQTDRRSGGV